MAKKRYMQAINEALVEEMERDPKVILYGEDVEISMFGDTAGLLDRFGRDRIWNSPICEATLTGMAVGAAAAGYRVVLHMMFSNFIYTGFDAIANQMAKLRLMTGGQVRLPITVIAGYGGGGCNAAQHSDTPYPVIMNLGGLRVAVPATPADAKGLLKESIRGDLPTFFLEATGRGGEMGEVPDGDHTTPFGVASVAREGNDVCIVTMGTMLKPSMAAAKLLASEGIATEVVDCRTLVPLDEEGILRSVAKT
ncbi:MAG: alpha-ketoacid dehydrogenase subunit beta, partial [Gammaproteobacteria bacterium]|nr:alpha-ketoacid dehydrogenase subunit beta [Gammaproteobacteria bacterium]